MDSPDAGALREIARCADSITSPVIRAFVLDVAWYRRVCGYDGAEAVVDAYLAVLDATCWPHCFARCVRTRAT